MICIPGYGVIYQALRVVHGRLSVVTCRGDEDRPEDVQLAHEEQAAVDRYKERRNA